MLGDICVVVVYKNIKNLHLRIYPPIGKVKISAPMHMDLDTIRVLAISKWEMYNEELIKQPLIHENWIYLHEILQHKISSFIKQ